MGVFQILIQWLVAPIVLQILAEIEHKRTLDPEFKKKSDETFQAWAEAKAGDDSKRKAALASLVDLLKS